ncbi:hypothetical protein Gohar_017615, partial [Gossypium harknessii]|nr:hypothetical protein [Gossypium harknessii]
MGHSRWYGRIYDRIVIQTDNMEVIGAINESLLKGSNSTLIRCILKLLQNEENWLIEYVPRNENRKANSITKLAFNREE